MKFSIRDLMWLTAVAAIAVGWYVDAARRKEENEELKMVIGLSEMELTWKPYPRWSDAETLEDGVPSPKGGSVARGCCEGTSGSDR